MSSYYYESTKSASGSATRIATVLLASALIATPQIMAGQQETTVFTQNQGIYRTQFDEPTFAIQKNIYSTDNIAVFQRVKRASLFVDVSIGGMFYRTPAKLDNGFLLERA